MSFSKLIVPILALALSLFTTFAFAWQQEDQDTSSRGFEFTYAGSVDGVSAGQQVRMWLPIPQDTEDQNVELLDKQLPAASTEHRDERYGNRFFYVEYQATAEDELENARLKTSTPFELNYSVVRRARHGLNSQSNDARERDASEKEAAKQFLSANRLVPITGKQSALLGSFPSTGTTDEIARRIYDRVFDHMDYDKSKPGFGSGDVLWACDSRTGNCTDFHSVFVSLCRMKGIPAKFQIGFPLPEERGSGEVGGYHCWAQFFDEKKGWVPVDISEADKNPDRKEFYFGNLDENRIEFTTGRDIILDPRQAGEPLNYFVYPYVEVDGRSWPMDSITLKFNYKDK